MMSFKNILTFDVEEWYDRNDIEIPIEYKQKKYVEGNLLNLIELLNKYNSKATFFFLGYIAKENPSIIKKVSNAGHEIASHHYYHNLLYDYTKEKFREEIRASKKELENITGKPVYGFRAPSWSINESNIWILDILKEEGFKYDASIYPIKNFLYGVKGAKTTIYEFSNDFFEVPPSVYELFLKIRIPFSGGFYFRAMPEFLIKYFINKNNKSGNPVIISLHPWEVFPDFKRMKLSLKESIIPYLNLSKNRIKFENILKFSKFTTVFDTIKIS